MLNKSNWDLPALTLGLGISLDEQVKSTATQLCLPLNHRVDRVLTFLSSRPNLDSPTPSPAGVCVPHPYPLVQGGGTHTLAGEGVGESKFRRGDRHCATLGIYVLCALNRAKHTLSSKGLKHYLPASYIFTG
jgi:hypothetical protein